MNVFKDAKTAAPGTGWIRQFLLSATVSVLVAALIAFISGCSVYKSQGRKDFESRSPDEIVDNNVGLAQPSVTSFEEGTCWSQPLKEPLWEVPEDLQIRVHRLSHDIIEVCLESTI